MGLTDAECVELLQWVCPKLRLRWTGFRSLRGQVCKRINRRMTALGLSTAAQYRQRLEEVPAEWNELDAACRVTISRFYRDRAVFDALRLHLLPALARRAVNEHRLLRCWSAGCCSGEEPYSLALMLRLAIQPELPELSFEIVATDSEARLIERAQRACYLPGTLVDLPREWESAFERVDRECCLRPEYRGGIRWSVEDIRRVVPDGPFDVILCRNLVFTYFEPSLQLAMSGVLVSRLITGGLLVIGGHEQLPEGVVGLVPAAGPLPLFRKL